LLLNEDDSILAQKQKGLVLKRDQDIIQVNHGFFGMSYVRQSALT
jgi:hypothetical protein